MGCGLTSPTECTPGNVLGDVVGGATGSIAGSAVENLANEISEAVADGLAALGTMWVNIDTPELAGGSSEGRNAGATPPGASGIETVLSYMLWIGLAVCVLSLMVAGVRMALPHRQQVEGGEDVARIGTVLMATIVISGGSALVGGLFRDGRLSQSSDTVSFIQNSLWWYVLALATASAIVAGIKMAWEQRSEPGRDLVRSLLTLILVSAAAIPVLGILVSAADEFSEWIIGGALKCDAGDTACFSDSLGKLLVIGSAPSGGTMAPVWVIVLGLVAILTSLIQVALMVARAGMLVLLAGILPLAAAATNTETGRGWFKKAMAWLVAWVLYKPAAAIVYATAFHLTGTNVSTDDGSGLVAAATGLMLMILAIVALPALMRFVTPAVSAVSSGGGAMGSTVGAGVANGAVSATGRWNSGGSHGSGGPESASGTSSPTATPTTPDATGASRTGSDAGGGFPGASGDSSGGPTGAPTGAPGTGSVGATTGASATGATTGAGAGAGAGGAGGSGAAAAGGPAGAAVVVAEVGLGAAKAAGGAAQSTADETTGGAMGDESGGAR